MKKTKTRMINLTIIMYVIITFTSNNCFSQYSKCDYAYVDFIENEISKASTSPCLVHFNLLTSDSVKMDIIIDTDFYNYLVSKSISPSPSKMVIGGYETLYLRITKKELLDYTHAKIFSGDSALLKTYRRGRGIGNLLDRCFLFSGFLKAEYYTDDAITTLVTLLQRHSYVLIQDDESGDYYIKKIECE